MSYVISVEKICKHYKIGHRNQYQSYGLRDFLEKKINDVKYKLRHPFSMNGSDVEEEIYWALKDVSFKVQAGERVGIIGSNGAGKSTLLKILSRIVTPSSGRVELVGKVVSLLEVGTGFHPELSGRENIYLNGSILGMTQREIKNKFNEIVAFADVEKFLDTPVKRYSSGMRVRLAFSVAAHLTADVMLVDEVLAVGDAEFQRKCLRMMDNMSEQGRTILFVSHNLETVRSLCERVILLDSGCLKSMGDPSSVIKDYLNNGQADEEGLLSKGYRVNADMMADTKASGLLLTSCELVNPSNTELGPRTKDPLIIRINYTTKRQWHSPAFVFRFKDSMGYEIIRLSTMPISGFTIEELYPSGSLQLLIHELPLVAGTYYIDISFSRGSGEWVFNLERAVKFEVMAQDVYGSGLSLDSTRGMIFVAHDWNHIA